MTEHIAELIEQELGAGCSSRVGSLPLVHDHSRHPQAGEPMLSPLPMRSIPRQPLLASGNPGLDRRSQYVEKMSPKSTGHLLSRRPSAILAVGLFQR